MAWKITIKGAKEATAAVQAAIRAGMRDGLEVAGQVGKGFVQEFIRTPLFGKPAAYATGIMHDAIAAEFQGAPAEGIFGREVIFAQPPADQYAEYVETGTRPHMPPVKALLLWVKLKFGAQDEKSALGIAWAVAKTIAKRGTQGHWMFARAFRRLEPMLQGILERGIGGALERAGVGK